jgi:hypothetical protein
VFVLRTIERASLSIGFDPDHHILRRAEVLPRGGCEFREAPPVLANVDDSSGGDIAGDIGRDSLQKLNGLLRCRIASRRYPTVATYMAGDGIGKDEIGRRAFQDRTIRQCLQRAAAISAVVTADPDVAHFRDHSFGLDQRRHLVGRIGSGHGSIVTENLIDLPRIETGDRVIEAQLPSFDGQLLDL